MSKQLPRKSQTYATQQDLQTLSSEPIVKKQRKKIIRKRSGESQDSNQSRRSLNTPKAPNLPGNIKHTVKSQFNYCDNIQATPKQKASRQQSKTKEGYTFVRLNNSVTVRKGALDTSNPKQDSSKISDKGHQVCSCKINDLEEQVKMHVQQIEFLVDQRDRLSKQNHERDFKIKSLQQMNRLLQAQLQKSQEQLRHLNVDKKKLDSEKQSLIKKIAFLQKINFSTETKNIQSYREQHLERELQACREKLGKQKSQTEKLLEGELNRTKQELFNLRKAVDALQISNSLLRSKLQQRSYFETSNEQYASLRSRYRKFLVEFKDLRREYQKLQTEHRQVLSQLPMKTDDDLSLDLSTL